MPQGDMTEVGEKGITVRFNSTTKGSRLRYTQLSGGQRARLSLARAVYARADLYVQLLSIAGRVLNALQSHPRRRACCRRLSRCTPRLWYASSAVRRGLRSLTRILDHVIGPYGLLSTKGRIVVTNSISFLKHFDKLVYLRRGLIIESGSYDDLTSNTETQLYKLMYARATTSLASVLTRSQ